jgi:hypothetical protein
LTYISTTAAGNIQEAIYALAIYSSRPALAIYKDYFDVSICEELEVGLSSSQLIPKNVKLTKSQNSQISEGFCHELESHIVKLIS